MANQKQFDNRHQDKEQYKRYQEILGSKAPESFASFSEMKYNNPNEWAGKKREYELISRITNHENYIPAYKDKLLDTYYRFAAEGHEFTVHGLNRFVGQKEKVGVKELSFQDMLDNLSLKPNYKDTRNGTNIRYYDSCRVVSDGKTNQIVTIVTGSEKLDTWEVYDD